VIDSPSSSSDRDCCIVEDLAPPVSSQPIETSTSNSPTQHPHTQTQCSMNTPIPLFNVDHTIQPNVDRIVQSNGDHTNEDHMIQDQFNGDHANEDHMTLSPSEDQVMSEHQPQCKGLQMLTQYDSDDSELEPGEVV